MNSLTFRIQCVGDVNGKGVTFQSSTQYGEDRRHYNDDFVFKVKHGEVT